MITPDYARVMARYNAWQNESLYGAADGLGDAERRRARGAFSARSTKRSSIFSGGSVMAEPVRRFPCAEGLEHQRVGFHDRGLGRAAGRAPRRRRRDRALGGRGESRPLSSATCPGIPACSGARPQAALGVDHAFFQPPDPSSRAGPCERQPPARNRKTPTSPSCPINGRLTFSEPSNEKPLHRPVYRDFFCRRRFNALPGRRARPVDAAGCRRNPRHGRAAARAGDSRCFAISSPCRTTPATRRPSSPWWRA